jgi:FkbH-like protein
VSAPGEERAVLQLARRAVVEGRSGDALDLLRSALRSDAIPPHAIARAGALVHDALGDAAASATPVLVLGQATTSWLAPTIAAVGAAAGLTLAARDGQFDQVLQDLSALPPTGRDDTVLVLLPWSDRLLAPGARPADARVADEVAYWQQVWSGARSRGISRIVQIGYDWLGPGPLGHHAGARGGGAVALVRRTNDALRGALPDDAYFAALDEISGIEGRRDFYDRRALHWTRDPFSDGGRVALARHVVAGIRALTSGPRKVLVLDLDNTLWGGVVGEVGTHGVALGSTPDGEAFLAFQRYVKGLAARGVLLAVCSKNNPEDALEPFVSHPDTVLRPDDFAAFEASWGSKVDGLRRIAATLRLGLDSMVFFDDNPAERDLVRRALPEVAVVEVPAEPAEFVRTLEEALVFETVTLTAEDARRTTMYASERQRAAEVAADDDAVEDHLRGLEMLASITPLSDADLPRAVQLLGKTNQFNLTTRRHGADRVRAFMENPRAVARTLRLRDRFGDHGLVGLLLAEPAPNDARTLVVDTLLMSCRVIGRTAEHALVAHVLTAARELGYETVRGLYRPSARNEQVRPLWPAMGFRPAGDGSGDGSGEGSGDGVDDGIEAFDAPVARTALPASFVRVDG